MNTALEFAYEMMMESFSITVGWFGSPDNEILAPDWSNAYWIERIRVLNSRKCE